MLSAAVCNSGWFPMKYICRKASAFSPVLENRLYIRRSLAHPLRLRLRTRSGVNDSGPYYKPSRGEPHREGRLAHQVRVEPVPHHGPDI